MGQSSSGMFASTMVMMPAISGPPPTDTLSGTGGDVPGGGGSRTRRQWAGARPPVPGAALAAAAQVAQAGLPGAEHTVVDAEARLVGVDVGGVHPVLDGGGRLA